MKAMISCRLLAFFLLVNYSSFAQDRDHAIQKGWFSLGLRSSWSMMGHDGAGPGAGGQFRIRFSERLNTDWFADYIRINMPQGVRSTYYHIGWSVLYYPFDNLDGAGKLQPYVLAGHCFDYNKKTVINSPVVSKDRWGAAIQAGLGTHWHLSERADLSFTSQYMTHLTKELEVEYEGNGVVNIIDHRNKTIEGHLLMALSFNYRIFRLWK